MVSYLSNISERRPVSMGTVVPTIRSFLLYLFNQGIIAHDFNVLLNIKCMKRNTLKPLFTENESERILKNINLTSAQGKRDYAIFMLAKHNGLRSSDILNLGSVNHDC
jgi:site-specific recombinase XerD